MRCSSHFCWYVAHRVLVWCTTSNSLHVIEDARAFSLHTVVSSHCRRRCKSKRSSVRMRTVALLKLAPAYSAQATDRTSAQCCFADQRSSTQVFNSHPWGSHMVVQTLYASFASAGICATVRGPLVSYVYANARHSSLVVCPARLWQDTKLQVQDAGQVCFLTVAKDSSR